MNPHIKRVSAFNYFGGKSRHLEFYYQHSPNDIYHYVEPFCGSAVYYLNMEPAPMMATISDLDQRIFNFFNVLRTRPDELVKLLELTPYNRNEFGYAAQLCIEEDPLEDARRFFVRCMQSFGGLSDVSRRINSWRSNRGQSRYGISLEVSKYWGKVKGLHRCIERLRQAQIENISAPEIITKYDTPQSFQFVDPPYVTETRTGKKDYNFEMTEQDHHDLARILNDGKSKFMLCGYDSKMYDELYPAPKWTKIFDKTRQTNLGGKLNREVIWINYSSPVQQLNLFA